MADFVTKVNSAITFESNGCVAAGFVSAHCDTLVYVVQTEKYTDKLQTDQQSANFCIFTNASLSTNGIATVDGVTLQQATRVKKNIRHAAALYSLFSKHKPHAVESVTIYDNELDKQNCGRLKVEFNKGATTMQEVQTKNRREFCKITNIFKSATNKPKTSIPPQMVIVGEKDFPNLKQFLHDASKHYKQVADQASAESQASLIFADLIAGIEEEVAPGKKSKKGNSSKRKRSVSPPPGAAAPKKKFTIPDNSSDSADEDIHFKKIHEEEQSD